MSLTNTFSRMQVKDVNHIWITLLLGITIVAKILIPVDMDSQQSNKFFLGLLTLLSKHVIQKALNQGLETNGIS